MSEITTPKDLFIHELGDILNVERKLAQETLPKLIGEVQDEEFRSADRVLGMGRNLASATAPAHARETSAADDGSSSSGGDASDVPKGVGG